ncbi:acetyltransferase [Hyphomonas johnsonii MHS-2]|uniref:Acetyltransferase n=2 Tax=Hyphomonas johnsonii TaxID=81031 RepID=A0A059FT88_9PROT|nr:acetyltransferase [Hyphomonas johnsonii MHS-2]
MVIAMRDTLITSERLVLMAPRRADFEDWSSIRTASRSHLEPWEPRWPTDANSKADWTRRLRAWTVAWKEGRAYVFLIRRVSDNALVGGASLTHVRAWPASSASLGYWLGADFEGQGYMREAVSTLCGWAFGRLGLWRIEAGTLAENDRSRQVLESVGFTEEGYARAYLEIAGERRDHVLFGLVRPQNHG